MDKNKLITITVSAALSVAAVLFFIIFTEAVTRFLDPLKKREPQTREVFKLDEQLFRFPFPKEKKKEGEFRILALGDSYTWGDGVSDKTKLWPEVLEKDLRGIYKRNNINVINMGICGFTTVNEFELFKKVEHTVEPDLVIIEYLINDVLPSGPNLTSVGEEWLSKSNRLNLIPNKKIHALQRNMADSLGWPDLYSDDFPGWIACKKAMSGFGYWSSLTKVKVVLALFPVFCNGRWSVQTYPNENLYDKAYRAAESSGLNAMYLLPAYIAKDKNFKEWTVSPTDAHPNEEAHAIAAEAIGDFIVKRNLTNDK
jgi:hypothetical protein